MLYSFWLFLVALGFVISGIGIGKFIGDPEEGHGSDVMLLLVGAITMIAVGLNASFLDFITNNGTIVTYSTMSYFTLPFAGVGFVDAAFVFIVIVKMIQIKNLQKFGYSE